MNNLYLLTTNGKIITVNKGIHEYTLQEVNLPINAYVN